MTAELVLLAALLAAVFLAGWWLGQHHAESQHERELPR